MELVYLWVEEYKNIKNQGFNFSARFTCKYENGTLTIDKKEPEPINIFPSNINITAIVGENGSSKSSILEAIKLLFKYSNTTIFHCIWRIENNFYSYGKLHNKEENLVKNHQILRITDQKEISINYFTHSSDILNTLLWMNQKLKLYDCSNDMVFGNLNISNPNDLRTVDLSLNMPIYYAHCQILLLKYFLSKDSENKIFTPNKYKLIMTETYFIRRISSILSYNQEESHKTLDEIKLEVQIYISQLFNSKNNIPIINRLYFFLEKEKNNSNIKVIEYFYNHIQKNEIPLKEDLEKKLIALYGQLPSELSILDNLIINENMDLEIHKITLLKVCQNNLFKNIFIDLYKIILYTLDQNKSIFYDDLSSGEKDSLLLLSLLHSYFEEKKSNQSSLILLDEIETFYHPNWSRNLIELLISHLKEKTHLILTSHSPFLLSDLPKENVIFLGKYKEKDIEVINQTQQIGNCKNVSKEITINTFGANIHTLLSHGFFMDGGLMGEFAKSKIQSVIQYHADIQKKDLQKNENKTALEQEKLDYLKNKQATFWQIQSIIGDDFIKQVIKNHLIEIEKIILGNDETKREEIKRLKAQIELLENRC